MNLYAIIPFGSFLINLLLAQFIVYINPKEKANRLFALQCIGMAIWSFCEFMMQVLPEKEMVVFWAQASSFSLLVPPVMLHFIITFTEKSRFFARRLLPLVYSSGLILLFLAPTSMPYDQLVTKTAWGWTIDYRLAETASKNSLVLLLGIYFLGTNLFAVVLAMSNYFMTMKKEIKQKARYIILGLFLHLLISFSLQPIAKMVTGADVFNPASASMIIFSLFVAYAIWKHNVFRFDPNIMSDRIIETMNDALCIVDSTGHILRINKGLTKLLGFDIEALMGKSLNLIMSEKESSSLLYMTLKNKRLTQFEATMRSEEHIEIPVSISSAVISSRKRSNLGIIIMARDMTSLKMSQKELEKYRNHLENLVKVRTEALDDANEKLRQSEKMQAIGELAGGVAHDFNNMLTVITGTTDLLQMTHGDQDPKLNRSLNRIMDASQNAANLTRELLAFARKGNYEMAVVDMIDVINAVIGLLSHTVDKRIKVKKDFHTKSAPVIGDTSQLQNALLNIGVNARDAMPQGGDLTFTAKTFIIDEAFIQKHLYFMNPGIYVQVSVTDTGRGMDETTRKRVFEPFFTTKEKGKGTGLGMAGVYGTIKKHNGSVEVYSEIDRGSTITIYLPLVNEKPDSDQGGSIRNFKGKGTILLVDDEDEVRDTSKDILIALGFTVFTSANGIEALEFYKNNKEQIDLVLLDLVMPKMGGYDCFLELKKITPDIRVLVISGFSADGEAQKILAQGALGFMQKPFNVAELSKSIKKAMKNTN